MTARPLSSSSTGPLLELRDVTRTYRTRISLARSVSVRAVDGVSLGIQRGETTCIVGETGSGKTTLGRILLGLTPPTSGEVLFRGARLQSLDRSGKRDYRRAVQMVFQSPIASFNPMLTIGASLRDAVRFADRTVATGTRSAGALLELVGLPSAMAHRYPNEVSGGELQRASIARALATDPAVIFLDEPASALDASVRGQIFNLLMDLQRDRGISYVMVTHDLASAEALAHRILVMYLGRVVEHAPRRAFFDAPRHPYSESLLAASRAGADADGHLALPGEPPSPVDPPSGCYFHTRCWLRPRLADSGTCEQSRPDLTLVEEGHAVACHFVDVERNE